MEPAKRRQEASDQCVKQAPPTHPQIPPLKIQSQRSGDRPERCGGRWRSRDRGMTETKGTIPVSGDRQLPLPCSNHDSGRIGGGGGADTVHLKRRRLRREGGRGPRGGGNREQR